MQCFEDLCNCEVENSWRDLFFAYFRNRHPSAFVSLVIEEEEECPAEEGTNDSGEKRDNITKREGEEKKKEVESSSKMEANSKRAHYKH